MDLMPLLDRLDAWKADFGQGDASQLEKLLTAAAKWRLSTPAEAIRLHETLLFLRAYPRSSRVARLADRLLFHFADRIARLQSGGADMEPFEAPEVSGIAGTSLCAVFSHDVASSLAARHSRHIDIGWDRCDEMDKFGPVLARILPLLAEDWPVEAHVPFREWIAAARPHRSTDLAWLLQQLAALPLSPGERSKIYGSLDLPLSWEIGDSPVSKSRLRLPGRKLFVHREPLIRRGDVSLLRELESPPLALRRLPPPEARRMLHLILDTSAMRFRELYGFSHPDERAVDHADLGRGVEIFFFGVPPEWRLPLRAYHAGMFFKNGVPAGYVELLSLFERAEVGFNLYYTFREGESAWLYARLLGLFHQVLGVNCFAVDPYQIGLENPEAIDSGAFWFYRKLGFRPVDPEAAALVAREERRIGRTPGYRSAKRTLERIAGTSLIYEGPGAEPGAWDKFRIRNLALAAQRAGANPKLPPLAQVLETIPGRARWTREEKRAAARILQAKQEGEESRYLMEMQRHSGLRAAMIRAGQTPPKTANT
ncbi:MAG: hypothetical protein NTW28_05635 [Candidatus Solibacter sp.]|nr:hypothetical protein [Candidatus Solibacter sp.]